MRRIALAVSIICLVLAPPHCGAEAQGQERMVVVKESSLKESFKETLVENQQLREEKQALEAKLKDALMKDTLNAGRIKMLGTKIGELEKDVRVHKENVDREKAEYQKKLDEIMAENEAIKERATAIEEASRVGYYTESLEAAEHELNVMKNKLRQALREKEKQRTENGKMHFNLGNYHQRLGDYRKAVYEYEVARKLLPGDPDPIYNLAILYDAYLENDEKALYYYKEYLRLEPQGKNASVVKEKVMENVFQLKAKD